MLSRRTFLNSVQMVGMSVVFAGTLAGLEAAAQATRPVRRSLGTLSLDDQDVALWRDFVAFMKAKAPGDDVSWIGFANIHGTTAGFHLCPHGDWYFLPWHRCYVAMYEQAVRDWSGVSGFAMPYWDWTADRQLPKAFSEPLYQGKPNPLFDSARTMSATASLPDNMVGPAVVAEILSATDFQVFGTSKNPAQTDLNQSWISAGGGVSGQLEANPHNRVHCAVGGQMCTSVSAQDPIFFMHHGNIDRIWATWNLRSRNTTDPLWLNMPFQDNFRKMDGTRYTIITRDCQSPEAMGYTYDLPPVIGLEALLGPSVSIPSANFDAVVQGAKVPTETVTVVQANNRAASALDPLSVDVGISAATIRQALGSSVRTTGWLQLGPQFAGAQNQIVAILRDVPAPAENTAEYRVFVNCKYLSVDVPTSDPHYVTTFGFFGTSGDHAGHGGGSGSKANGSYLVNLTAALQRLARRGELAGDSIAVQIIAVPRPGVSLNAAAPITPRSVEVAIL